MIHIHDGVAGGEGSVARVCCLGDEGGGGGGAWEPGVYTETCPNNRWERKRVCVASLSASCCSASSAACVASCPAYCWSFPPLRWLSCGHSAAAGRSPSGKVVVDIERLRPMCRLGGNFYGRWALWGGALGGNLYSSLRVGNPSTAVAGAADPVLLSSCLACGFAPPPCLSPCLPVWLPARPPAHPPSGVPPAGSPVSPRCWLTL